jgi:hypothetical protein
MWVTFPRSASSGYHVEFHKGCYRKHTDLLTHRTSSLDISGYYADCHEGRGTVGEWQRNGMACVNYICIVRTVALFQSLVSVYCRTHYIGDMFHLAL